MRNVFLFLANFLFSANCLAFEPALSLTDREIIESLAELKAGQVGLDKRYSGTGILPVNDRLEACPTMKN